MTKGLPSESPIDECAAGYLEPVAAPSYDGEFIEAIVKTTGGTSSSSFRIEHSLVSDVCELSIIRHKMDFARMAPMRTPIKIEWESPVGFSNATIKFMNPELPELTVGVVKGGAKPL